MPLRIGETFAGYRILRLLGSGGMGEVYLVQHPRLPRRDALKVLRPDISSDSSFRERFIREADLSAALRHPHIVGIHDRGEDDGQLWIAMDYVDGTDAAQLIQQRYPAGMPAALTIPIITAVASALDHAHKKGLLHRDVKPANIIVADLDSEDRSVFLTDFGIARPIDDVGGITTTNMTVGTVAYAAPEQLMGEEMDGRVDQYALAATAFHMLTGLQLFPHSNPAVVISRHLSSPPPQLGNTRSDLARLDPVLAVALAKSPDERFARCRDFALTLAEEAVAARGEASPTALTKSAAASSKLANLSAHQHTRAPNLAARQRRWWAITAAIVVGALAIAGTYALLIWSSQDQQASTPTTPPLATSKTAATTASDPSPPSVASQPPTATTTQVPQGNGYALTGCYYSPDNLPVDRPTSVGLFFCASGGMSVEDMSWSSWGPFGADGTGTANFRVCQPSCAQGYEVPTPVVIHAWNPLPSPGDSGCPRDVRFFADMILAFPSEEPPLEANMPALSRYNGMPAIRYTSYSDPGPPIQVMGPPSCY